MARPPGLDWLVSLQATSSLDVQFGLTVLVLIAAVLIVKVFTSSITRLSRQSIDRIVERSGLRDGLEAIAEYAPWWVSGRLVVRFLQLSVLGLTIASLLLIWGGLSAVLALIDVVAISMPVIVNTGLTVLIFVLGYVAVEVLDAWLTGLTEHSEDISDHQEEIAFRVLQIVVFSTVILASLTLWNVDLGGLLVGAGFLGIVLGMAARQTLGSLLAGFVLMFSRPFEIGDWIEIGDEEGIVTEISIVNTRLQNFDGEFVILPNDIVSNSTIVNRSRKGRIRVRVDVGIDYGADLERAKESAIEAVMGVENILTVPRPQAITKRLDDSAVVLELRFWIDKPSASRR
ncbi:MAG: mechanosensitive ion channel family protein, partial [Halodesulfurarchaeum sp.]